MKWSRVFLKGHSDPYSVSGRQGTCSLQEPGWDGKQVGAAEEPPPQSGTAHLLLNPGCYQPHASDRYLEEVSP